MNFDRYSAGEISSRDTQSVGDSIKRCCVDGHLADSVISVLPYNGPPHRLLRRYRPCCSKLRPPTRGSARQSPDITLATFVLMANIFDALVAYPKQVHRFSLWRRG